MFPNSRSLLDGQYSKVVPSLLIKSLVYSARPYLASQINQPRLFFGGEHVPRCIFGIQDTDHLSMFQCCDVSEGRNCERHSLELPEVTTILTTLSPR